MTMQPEQRAALACFTPEYARALEHEDMMTYMAGDKPMVIAGVLKLEAHRGLLWSFIDQNAGPYMLQVVRMTKRYFDIMPYTRVEANVDYEFKAGHKLVKALGMALEAPKMLCYYPNGRSASQYVLIKKAE